ncbi:hypothetical protein DH2020_035277 [Rehmannia glutinosa]|uniref:Uncharacterized protein n=1 Tax=Rehmannia glutinosa TaxID=99300 RepID=A0ABR0V6X0_REHGL
MVDTKTVISQVQEIHIILHDLVSEGMILSESFQVSSLIKKLPPSWSDFARGLKHKSEIFSLEELFVALRIEDKHHSSQQSKNPVFQAIALIIANPHKPKPKIFKKTGPKKANGGFGNNKFM